MTKNKPNNWVWTELTESLKPERKAGASVPVGYLIEGHSEYFPRLSWVMKGYVALVNDRKEEN